MEEAQAKHQLFKHLQSINKLINESIKEMTNRHQSMTKQTNKQIYQYLLVYNQNIDA